MQPCDQHVATGVDDPALDAAGIGRSCWDLRRNGVHWSRRHALLFGRAPDEPIGAEAFLACVHPEDRERVTATLDRARTAGEMPPCEFRVSCPDGTVRWIQWSGSVARDASGPATIDALAVDITARKALEEERDALLVQTRTAERTNQVRDEFFATVSYELRNPINNVLAWAQLLRSSKPHGPRFARAIETIERNARIQAHLIEDIVDVAQVITGRLRLDRRSVDPGRIVRAAVDGVRMAADAKGVRLSMSFEANADMVYADAARLQQVVWNLLTNAIAATPSGGTIEVRVARGAAHAEITVRDTGAGIPADALPFVFERIGHEEGHDGAGLGLMVVRHLVELHGGTVEAQSTGRGKGTTFVVRVPYPALQVDASDLRPIRAAREEREAAHPDSAVLRGLRVLVVDDEPDARELLSFVLDEYGAKVTAAASTDEALEALSRSLPDVLVSDIGMPRRDGYELIREVRARAADCGRDVPSLALTAYASSDDVRRALTAGFQRHVPKPIDPESLVAIVASLAGRDPRTAARG